MIDAGIPQLNHVIVVLLGTGMFVGGLFAFVLDNTVPGKIIIDLSHYYAISIARQSYT